MSVYDPPQPLKHSGDSHNIAYYGERDKPQDEDGRLWCEVLRSAPLNKHDYAPVRFRFTIYRTGVGVLGEFTHTPVRTPKPGRLPERTVSALVGDWLMIRLREQLNDNESETP